MARTRGAKDTKPRKKPARRGPDSKQGRADLRGQKPKAVPVVERPAIPPDDFATAVAAELGQQAPATPGASEQPATPALETPGFDPAALTLDGLASAWQVPFWLLGWALKMLRIIPEPDPVLAVGKRRATDLARPSYEIYTHYAREYLSINPENTVQVAAGVTGLNAIGILPELTEAIVKSRQEWIDAQRRAQQSSRTEPAGQT